MTPERTNGLLRPRHTRELARLGTGESLDYIGPRGLRDFDLVLSYTGDGSRRVAATPWSARVEPLYGHVDPICIGRRRRGALSCGSVLSRHLCRRSAAALLELLVGPASLACTTLSHRGAHIRKSFMVLEYLFRRHLPRWSIRHSIHPPADPERHAARHGRDGWCPRALFEAAACGPQSFRTSGRGSLPSSRRAPKSAANSVATFSPH